MISAIRTYSNLSIFKKMGISGVCTAIGYGLGSTNPVTLIALAALPWVPSGVNRCLRRNRPEGQGGVLRADHRPAAIFSDRHREEKKAQGPGAGPFSEDEQLNWALAESIKGLDEKKNAIVDPDGMFARALALSTNVGQQVFVCPYAQAISMSDKAEEESLIPPDLLFANEKHVHCNVANFILHVLMNGNLLDQGAELRDLYGNQISERDIKNALALLGIDFSTFLQIWKDVAAPEARGGIHDIDVEKQIDLRKDARVRFFKFILATSHKRAAREAEKYLDKYQAAVWNKR